MDYPWWTTIILGLIIIYCIKWLIRKRTNYWKDRNIKHIQFELISPIYTLLFPKEGGIFEMIGTIYKFLDGEKIGGFYQLFQPVLMIRDPELINQVLVKDFSYFVDRNYEMQNDENLFSLMLGSLVGDKWRNARYKLTPTFTTGKLKLMVPHIKKCGQEMIDFLENNSDREFDSQDLMRKYVINVIGKIAFGIDVNSFNENDRESKVFVSTVGTFIKPSLGTIIKLSLSTMAPRVFKLSVVDKDADTFIRNLTKDCLQYRKNLKDKRNDFLDLLIEERKKEKDAIDGRNKNNVNYNQVDGVEADDNELIDQMNNMKNDRVAQNKEITFTEEFICSQVLAFLSAGTDTTSLQTSYFLYELAINQDIQEHLRNEINDTLEIKGFNFDAVTKMEYLDLCLRENLRLHPIIHGLNRICTQRYKIPGTDLIIDEGQMVFIPVFPMHKDPQYYTDPEEFQPNRFQNVKAMQSSTYLPFGGGPRFCIAMRLAILEMKMIIVTLLSHYKITLSNKTKLPLKFKKYAFFPEPDGGLWIKLEKLNKTN